MYEVNAREMPQRSLLCLKRNVDVSGLWGFGKEFIGIIRDQGLPEDRGPGGTCSAFYWAR